MRRQTRLVLVLLALAVVLGAAMAWRAAEQRRRQAQHAHELELMKQGGRALMEGIGTPAKAREQTGDPFGPGRPAPPDRRPTTETPR